MTEEKKKEGVPIMEIRGIIRMLKVTAGRAEDLVMTGGPIHGSAAGVRQYNAVLKRISNSTFANPELFIPLEEDASFVDLGIACEQLAAYLGGITEAAEPGKAKKAAPQIMGPVSIKVGDVGELGDLGEIVRKAIPSWLKGKMDVKVDVSEEEKKEPEAEMNDLESRIAELGAQMQALAERMSREEMSSDEIRKLADQMRELGQQQSELAKKHAAIRAPKDAQ
jgi:hypothetical protein